MSSNCAHCVHEDCRHFGCSDVRFIKLYWETQEMYVEMRAAGKQPVYEYKIRKMWDEYRSV